MVWSTAVAVQEGEIGADTPNLPFNRLPRSHSPAPPGR
jgi:hypothetical protein